jgi:hypothetical protein
MGWDARQHSPGVLGGREIEAEHKRHKKHKKFARFLVLLVPLMFRPPYLAPVMVAIMITISIVPVSIMIPAVLVLDLAAAASPVTLIIFTTLIVRGIPGCSRIWCARPVALMPSPVVSYRIPVAVNPHIIWSGTSRKYTDYTWRWRWTDSDSKRNLSAKHLSGGQECNTEQNCSKKPLHVFRPPDLLAANTLPKIKNSL